jgi:Transposase zinc-binding domain
MTRPPWEVADIIRGAGNRFIERYSGALTWAQLKVLRAIERCRTAALGGHRDQCVRCGHRAISYNSCRNRHCPKCQTNAREKWLCARQRELLPVCYFHLVFSVPHALVPLIWQNKKLLFGLLFDASDPYYRNDAPYSRPRGSGYGQNQDYLIGRVMSDLGQAASHVYLDGHERKHFDEVAGNLQDFQARWSRGHFDTGKLDKAIHNLEHLAQADRVRGRDREMLARDLYDLRQFRATRGGYYQRPGDYPNWR